MPFPSYTYTFANSTTADATQVNQDFTDILNGVTDGTKNINVSAGTFAGTLTANGNVTLGTSSSNTLTINASLSSSIVIGTTNSYDVGASALALRSVYLASSDGAGRATRVIGATVGSNWTMTLPTTGGSSGQVLKTDGSGTTSWGLPAVAPTIQKFTSTGSTTGYAFTVTAANATVGATYTNNANTYTVLATIAGGTLLFCSQASAPTASGTLTKSGGSGDATITFSAAAATATYTTPSSPAPLYLRVRMIGGGSGGTGGGVSPSGGNFGVASYFGSNLLQGGGAALPGLGSPGAGGTASLGSGPIGLALSGAIGSGGGENVVVGDTAMAGGAGAASPLGGGGGAGASGGGNASNAAANTGAGGGGGGGGTGATSFGGTGGSCGGFVDAIITSPAATYPYAVGVGGSGGSAGTGGGTGGNGAAGLIEVTEYYC